MIKKYRILFLFLTFTTISAEGERSSLVSKELADASLHSRKHVLELRSLPINKDLLVEYNIFFKKMVSRLYRFVKQADIDLEYWKNEDYIEHRIPWYYKSLYRQLSKKKYHKKISVSISKLKLLKKEACTLLGLFHEYSFYFKMNRVDDAVNVLKTVEFLFPMPEEEASLVFTGKIKKYCDLLQSQYKKHKAPSHFGKHWRSYTTAAAAVGVAAYLYSQNETKYKEKYGAFKLFLNKWWRENISDNMKLVKNWIKEGVFYPISKEAPKELLQVLKVNSPKGVSIKISEEARGKIIDFIKSIKKVHLPPALSKLTKLTTGRHTSVGDLTEENLDDAVLALVDFLEKIQVGKGTIVEIDEFAFNEVWRKILYPLLYNGQKRNQGVVLAALLSSVVVVGAVSYTVVKGSYDRFFKKNLHVDPARHNIKRLHQIVHTHEKLECEQNGALYAHINMLLETLVEFPTDVAQTIYEDSIELRDILTPIEEKREIVNRWYSTYDFLRI